MDHIYTVFRRNCVPTTVPTNSEWMTDGAVVISVSSRNTIAFTTNTDLQDLIGKMTQTFVYVADLNVPWEAHKVLSHNEIITCVEWDVSGNKLLIADTVGNILIWAMKDFLLNDWTQISSTSFRGEHILSCAWFHNGRKIGLNMEKKDSSLYLEKYTHVKFGPSVRQFGGRPSDGCIAVSSSGLVCVIILQSDFNCTTSKEILGQFRNKLKVVDMCYAKNGDFLVVASDGQVHSSVHCYRVALKINQEKCIINCQPFSSFYLSCHTSGPTMDKQSFVRVTHLKFVLREAADAVVVSASGPMGSIVELWELREKPVTFHKMFHNTAPDIQPKTVGWQHHASSTALSSVVGIATPRLSIYDISPPPSYILVAYKDCVIKCFYRESLQLVCSISVNTGTHRRDDHSLKQYFGGTTLYDMQLTWTGCTLIAIDSLSQLFLYRLSPITDPGGPMSVNYAITMLEYCLMTGTDCWDVILSLRPGLIETICEKLTESFNKQSIGIQQYWYSRFLALKGSLYRCISTGQAKAGDCHALIMLNAVATAMKGLLRPRDLSTQDKGPTENLNAVMNSKGAETIVNIDKVLIHLESKEFTVEPPILQSLQHLTQWVADTALFILSSLPQQYHNHLRFPGGGLISDPKALNTLRELLVIIRIWSFLNESCLPVFTKMSENLDVLALLFILLTKTLMCHGIEPDEKLLDECGLLPNQVLVPTIEVGINAQGVASPALFINSLPLQFEYFNQPDFLCYTSKVHSVEGTIPLNHKVDIVRHVSLGANPSTVRQCTRCSSSSMLKAGARSAATRAWDQRWLRFCPCGGQWRMVQSTR